MNRLAPLALLALAAILPLVGVYPLFLTKCLTFALFAMAFNLFTGYVGLLSIGHASFFGMGAYIAGYAAKAWGMPTPVALLAGIAVATALGAAFGAIAIRRRGIYFAMITLALAQMVYFFCSQAPFTGAEDGLQNIPRGTAFGLPLGDDLVFYYFVLALTVLAYLFIQTIIAKPFGETLQAIRDNEPRAISLGYDVRSYKLVAFTISAAIAGLAGSLKAFALGVATLPDVHWTQSGNVILMCLLGGMGTALGPIVGAIVVVLLENQLASLGVIRLGFVSIDFSTKAPIVIGIVFMLCVLLFRRGIVGEVIALFGKRGLAVETAPRHTS
ncbi:branched-chain amino acid ABC transporter permease [Bosea sp. (in: a-proteobacteria)]|jgi:branched-chain amino acid transport system permease protein|uniref:branched-chain amino acid ABC transporter permease n=1 Tax=Bosea sp. (in: a-proteobacteria) TaxID=1871050 RepID=UPI002DDD5EF3|nr:branched-chain amino acid ABC transporter permease [Bosea sp. (in: a-proteobacteria)]HEV2510313.1 branched-chain amino acid ABC transporter permease [Bosea sp. (in: a-proteobacteria)]